MAVPATTATTAAYSFPEAGTWIFDRDHTTVAFEARHLMVAKVHGVFRNFAGAVTIGATPESSSATLTIQVASVESGFADRDAHLRSADFFDVERHPEITVRAAGLRHIAGERWAATAALTVRGVTLPVELTIEFSGTVNDPWGNRKIGFSVAAEIDREAWGLTWNAALEAGGIVAGKKVRLAVDVEAVLATTN